MASASATLARRTPPRHRTKLPPAADPMPRHVPPMLAVLSEMPTDQQNWAFEYKWDGVRALAYYDAPTLSFVSRNQLDITRRYPELQGLAKVLGKRTVVLDGEIIALDENDRPSFPQLQRRMHVNDPASITRLVREVPIVFVVFDVIYLAGKSLMDQPYTARRATLEKLKIDADHWQTTPSHVGHGTQMLATAKKIAMEGVVAKWLDSTYEPGQRSPYWRKIKVVQRQEFVIAGFTGESTGDPNRIGTMLLGYYDKSGKLHYAGHVGTGLVAKDHPVLLKQFAKYKRPDNPFVEKLPTNRRGGMKIQYLQPRLVGEIEYRRWPRGGMVQQASFKGLRADKAARDVVREVVRK
jgi:bifunctional non-homologous end joining protein LigD